MNEPCPLLQSLPPELMTEIFSHLPSLSDVFAFAAAHIQFRSIWHQNSNTIYATVAPKCIPCERYARSFVAQQTGREEASNEIQADDALKVVQNSSVVEKAIFQFEKQVVKRAKVGPYDPFIARKFYGSERVRHPPYLTKAERPRFIRSYYQLWGMMKMSLAAQQAKLETMTLKTLYQMHEMCELTQSIGCEEPIPAPCCKIVDDYDSERSINWDRSDARCDLQKRIWKRIETIYYDIHKTKPIDTSGDALYDGWLVWVVMWDHWQRDFKNVCLQQFLHQRPEPPDTTHILWEDSSDEEL